MYIPKKRKLKGVNRQRSINQEGGLYGWGRFVPKSRWEKRKRKQYGGIFRGVNRQRSNKQDGGFYGFAKLVERGFAKKTSKRRRKTWVIRIQ